MDWIELLIVVVFFGAPLLARLFQQKPPAPQKPPPLPPSDAQRGDVGDLQWLPGPAQAPVRLPAPAKEGGWSAGWGEWPGLEADTDEDAAELAGEDIAGDHDLDTDSIHTREAVSLEPVTAEEGRVRALPAAPVALDTVEVDWNQEHQRFHDKYFKPAAAAPRADRLADHLRSRREVRRAVLLAEVLGPPRALRDLEADR